VNIDIANGLLHDTEDREVRSQIDAEVCAIEALSVVSLLSQLTRGIPGCLKPTGFQAISKCSTSHPHVSCGKAQEAHVLLTQSRTALLACVQEVLNGIEQRHGSESSAGLRICT